MLLALIDHDITVYLIQWFLFVVHRRFSRIADRNRKCSATKGLVPVGLWRPGEQEIATIVCPCQLHGRFGQRGTALSEKDSFFP